MPSQGKTMHQHSLEDYQHQAEQGDARSQFMLSQYCFQQRDLQNMMRWLRLAAEQAMPEALDALGYCLEKGMGTERDMLSALDNYRHSADAGSAQAAYRYADLLFRCDLTQSRSAEVCRYWQQASTAEFPLALRALSFLRMLAEGPTPAVLECLRQSAQAGDPVAQFNLGCCLAPTDADSASSWLQQAAAKSYPLATTAMHALQAGDNGHSSDLFMLPLNDAGDDNKNSINPEWLVPAMPSSLQWEELHELPLVSVAHKALSLPECAYLIHLATPLMKRAQVISADESDPGSLQASMESRVRTSDSTFLPLQVTDMISHFIDRKISLVTDIDICRSEPFSVLHYQPGQYYKPHFDYFDPDLAVSARLLRDGGQRCASAVIYLSDVEAGGGTGFPELELEVPARLGSLCLFHNCRPDGSVEPRSLHAGLPVEQGDKWVATKWYRESKTSYLPEMAEGS
jgi:hypothetical protein